MSLSEGQYQIGTVKFGRNTNISIVTVDEIGYQVSAGDYQTPMSDEMRFTKDYVQPGVIQFQLAALDNKILPSMAEAPEDLAIQVVSGKETLEFFKKEWRADDVRKNWGWVKPLTYCAAGSRRVLYGRPRDIASGRLKANPGWYGITAAYQLADTLSYSEEVFSEIVAPTGAGSPGGSIERLDGTAPSWLSLAVIGPINAPTIAIGDFEINLNYNIPNGQAVEISSAPWERRAISSTGVNLGTKLIGNSPYLEDLRFSAGEEWNIALHGTGTSSATQLLVQWREAYHAV